jgi:hypothetical protein
MLASEPQNCGSNRPLQYVDVVMVVAVVVLVVVVAVEVVEETVVVVLVPVVLLVVEMDVVEVEVVHALGKPCRTHITGQANRICSMAHNGSEPTQLAGSGKSLQSGVVVVVEVNVELVEVIVVHLSHKAGHAALIACTASGDNPVLHALRSFPHPSGSSIPLHANRVVVVVVDIVEVVVLETVVVVLLSVVVLLLSVVVVVVVLSVVVVVVPVVVVVVLSVVVVVLCVVVVVVDMVVVELVHSSSQVTMHTLRVSSRIASFGSSHKAFLPKQLNGSSMPKQLFWVVLVEVAELVAVEVWVEVSVASHTWQVAGHSSFSTAPTNASSHSSNVTSRQRFGSIRPLQ